jgi:hypothetical protein
VKYLVILLLILTGCSSQKLDTADTSLCESNFEKCSDFIAKNERNGVIVIGFLLREMTNKGELQAYAESLSSISLKNIDTGNRYQIDFKLRNFGAIEVEPGGYCLDYIKTTRKFPLEKCKKSQITVKPGEIKNAGYWLAGIRYTGRKTHFRVFDMGAKKIDLLEKAKQYYGKNMHNWLITSSKVDGDTSIAGFWYAAGEDFKVFEFSDGNLVFNNSGFRESKSLLGTWSWKNSQGAVKLHNNFGEYRLTAKEEKLVLQYENIEGSGGITIGFRNPFRNWSLEHYYDYPVINYQRSNLDAISKKLNKSIFFKVSFNSVKPPIIPRIGKKTLMRPEKYYIKHSNVGTLDEELFLEDFYKWRFSIEASDYALTVCVINGSYPEECRKKGKNVLVFELGNKFPVYGAGI